MLDRKLIDNYLDYMRNIKSRSENTINNYKVDLRLLFDFLDGQSINSIQDVTLNELHGFITHCVKEGNSASTRARRVASIKSFFKYLKGKLKVIAENPADDLESPKVPERKPKYLNLKDSQNLLALIDGTHKERDFAIITMFLNCGLRVSELVSIDINHIKGDKLMVIGKGDKERPVYLNEATIQAINNYLDVRPNVESDALFVSQKENRISVSAVQSLVKRHLAKADVDSLEDITVHSLRHTAATLMYKYGDVDIRRLQEILGHTNLSTTEIYTHTDEEGLKNAMKSNPLNIF